MNMSLTMEHPNMMRSERPLEGALAFLASRSRKSERQISISASDVFKGAADISDQLLMNVIEKRTDAAFWQAFEVSFPKYAAITLALSSLAQAMLPPDVLNRLTREYICELEADFRDKALAAFGASVRDQVLFTVWTLRKVKDLLEQISTAKADDSKQAEDEEYSKNFTGNALRANFSLDCLRLALRMDRPIYPEVLEQLKDGLRSMVNAYTWARRGVALRIPAEAEIISQPDISDNEDDELLRSSMQDMAFMLDAEESH